MLFLPFAEDENVRALSRPASIPHPEGHSCELEQAERGGECCLKNVYCLVDLEDDVAVGSLDREVHHVADGVGVWNH